MPFAPTGYVSSAVPPDGGLVGTFHGLRPVYQYFVEYWDGAWKNAKGPGRGTPVTDNAAGKGWYDQQGKGKMADSPATQPNPGEDAAKLAQDLIDHLRNTSDPKLGDGVTKMRIITRFTTALYKRSEGAWRLVGYYRWDSILTLDKSPPNHWVESFGGDPVWTPKGAQ